MMSVPPKAAVSGIPIRTTAMILIQPSQVTSMLVVSASAGSPRTAGRKRTIIHLSKVPSAALKMDSQAGSRPCRRGHF